MPTKTNRRRDIDEDEGLDTQIDPNEEEDLPEEDELPEDKWEGGMNRSNDKGKGKRVLSEDEDEEEDPDGERLEGMLFLCSSFNHFVNQHIFCSR